ncbi:MAG: hypothetical protein ACRC1M_05355 [Methanobacteriaceae archaeon]
MLATTKMYDRFQTVVPAEVRKMLDIDKNYIIEWDVNEEGQAVLSFVKKLSLDEMIGRYTSKEPIDAVELKRKFKNGEIR